MENYNNTDELIMKHLTGEMSADERIIFDAWLNESDKHRRLLEQMSKAWNQVELEEFSTPDVNDEWNKLSAAINEKPKRIFSLWQISVAASFLIVALSSYFYFFSTKQLTISNPNEFAMTVTLPDSSLVRLSKNAQLSYDESSFNHTDRNVNLVGNAFFEVKHEQKNPFTVFTKNASVTVLGTKFRVNADSPNNNVIVTEGRVAFKSLTTHESVILVKGMKSALNAENTPLPPMIDSLQLGDQLKNLTIDRLAMSEVADLMYQYFGYDVIFADNQSASMIVTGSFANPTAESVIRSLSMSLNLRYSLNQNTITISR